MITHSVYTLARILQSYEKAETSTCYIPATWSRKKLSNEGLNPPYNTRIIWWALPIVVGTNSRGDWILVVAPGYAFLF